MSHEITVDIGGGGGVALSSSSGRRKIFDICIDREELAQALGVSPSFISKLMAFEGLPYFKIGRAVRFDVDEVKSWLKKRKKP